MPIKLSMLINFITAMGNNMREKSNKLIFSTKDVIWRLLCLSKWKCINRLSVKRRRNYRIYNQAVKEFKDETDLVTLVNSIRKLNAFIDLYSNFNSNNLQDQCILKTIKVQLSPTNSKRNKADIKPK